MNIEVFNEWSQGERVDSPRSLEACRSVGLDPKILKFRSSEYFLKKCNGDPEKAAVRKEHWAVKRTKMIAEIRHERQLIIRQQEGDDRKEKDILPAIKNPQILPSFQLDSVAPSKTKLELRLEEEKRRRAVLEIKLLQKAERASQREMSTQSDKHIKKTLNTVRARSAADTMRREEELTNIIKFKETNKNRETIADKVIQDRAARAAKKRETRLLREQVMKEKEDQKRLVQDEYKKQLREKEFSKHQTQQEKAAHLSRARELLKREVQYEREERLAQRELEREREIQLAVEKQASLRKHLDKVEEGKKCMATFKALLDAEKEEKRRQVTRQATELEERRKNIFTEKIERNQATWSVRYSDRKKLEELKCLQRELATLDRQDLIEKVRRRNEFSSQRRAEKLLNKETRINQMQQLREGELKVLSTRKHIEWIARHKSPVLP